MVNEDQAPESDDQAQGDGGCDGAAPADDAGACDAGGGDAGGDAGACDGGGDA